MVAKKRIVKVGQICWLTGGYSFEDLNFRLVKVTKLTPSNRTAKIQVKLLNPREGDSKEILEVGIGVYSTDWLLIYPEEYHKHCEGTPESITQPEVITKLVCQDCNTILTKKMKFCPNCGKAVNSTLTKEH